MKKVFSGALTLALALPATALAADGAEVWKAQKCAKCHGDTGKADSKMGQKKKISDMTTAEWQKKKTDDQMKKAILEGIEVEIAGEKQQMQAYKDKLKEGELDALITLIRAWAPKG